MTSPEEILCAAGFSTPHSVVGRASIADLFKRDRRCGIYVLEFSNGELYIGQAVDVSRRYVQHRLTHRDICRLSFVETPREGLASLEREVLESLERSGFPLRNISLASAPVGPSDLDLVITPDDQQRWMNDPAFQILSGDRLVDPDLRRKHARQYDQFMTRSAAADVIPIVTRYISATIPAPRLTEVSFWSCTCLPNQSGPAWEMLLRVNVHWQEVFAVGIDTGKLFFDWYLALSPLEAAYGPQARDLTARYDRIELLDHRYKPGGVDQVHLSAIGIDTAQQLLREPGVLAATRLLNLRLMRKGACNFGRHHCLDLADRFLDAESTPA